MFRPMITFINTLEVDVHEMDEMEIVACLSFGP